MRECDEHASEEGRKVKKSSKAKSKPTTSDTKDANKPEYGRGGETGKGASKKRMSTKDDAIKPKRVKNSYFWYTGVNRAAVMTEDGITDVKEVSKVLGARWREMTVEQKAPYVQMYEDAKNAQKMETTASSP